MENTTLFNVSVNTTYSDYYNHSGPENYTAHHEMNEPDVFVIIMGISLLVSLLGITGNGLVIWFCTFRMKKRVNVVWFLNLAVADFFCAFLFPLLLTQNILKYWPFGRFMCKLLFLLVSLNINVSVLQLTVISIDRCICVMFPVWCHNHRRPRLAFLVTLIIWMVSVPLAIPTVILTDVYSGGECILGDSEIIKVTIFEFVFIFLLPLIIIVFCYIVIVLHIRRKHIFTSSKPFKSIVAIIIAFFICTFPYHLFSLLFDYEFNNINFHVLYYGHLISWVLYIMNSCINPIIYVFIGRDFKAKFCGSLQATFKKAFIEDEDKTDFETQEQHIALSRLHEDYEEEDVIAHD